MDLNQALSWRKTAGKVCGFFCLLLFLAVLDGLIAKFREPVHVFHVLQGEEVDINGPIPEHIKKTEALTYISDSPDLAVAFETTHSGYFLGGNMWRGRLAVGKNLPPGQYTVTVRPRDYPPDNPGYEYRVVVYPDSLSQRAGFQSVIKRRTGTSPYVVAAAFLPFMVISLGAVFLLGRRIERLQAEKGLAEIYHVARKEGQYQVAFGLGTRHGLSPGDQVTLVDPDGRYVGVAKVEKSSAEDSVASTIVDQHIRPGYFVSRHK